MNYSDSEFKALNINAHAFKEAAASIMLFVLRRNECVRDDMALTWTAIQTVLYCIYSSCVTSQPFLNLHYTLR